MPASKVLRIIMDLGKIYIKSQNPFPIVSLAISE
jgi:hypothetical protein